MACEEEEREASQFTDLIAAAVCGDADGVKRHINQAGKKVAGKMTALMYAAKYGHLECVKILAPLEKGMKDNSGRTALMHADKQGHLECVKILAPLEQEMKDKDGRTAKSIASSNKDCYDYLS